MDLLALNEDILLDIVSFLDSADASSLSRTSRRVYIIGKQQALATMEIRLTSMEEVRLFCQYVLADRANLMRCVRDLTVDLPRPHPSDDLRLLTIVLQGALQLRRLRIDYFANLVHCDPGIKTVVSALPSLEELDLNGACLGVTEVLTQLRSAPRILHLQRMDFDPEVPLLPSASSCSSSLKHVETLHLGRMEMEDLMVPGSADTSWISFHHAVSQWPSIRYLRLGTHFRYAGPQWSSVRYLHLLQCHIPMDAFVHIFVDAFPSLETLHWVDPMVVDIRREVLWQNVQLHHVEVDCMPFGGYLACDAGGHLDLDLSDATLGFYVADHVKELIFLMAPVSFMLHPYHIDTSLEYLVAHIPSVKLFEITVHPDEVPPDLFMQPVEDEDAGRFRNAIQSLSALHLFCIIIGTFQMTGDYLMENVSGFKEHFERISSIRYLAIGVRHEGYLWYRIHRLREEGPVFEELPRDVGERVRQYLWSADADTLRSIHETDVPPSLFD